MGRGGGPSARPEPARKEKIVILTLTSYFWLGWAGLGRAGLGRGQAGLGWAGRYIVKTLVLIVKRTWGIHHAQNLIKPVENEDSGPPFSNFAPKMIQKALPREGFRNAFPERRETL